MVFPFNWHRTHIAFCWFCRIFPFPFRSCPPLFVSLYSLCAVFHVFRVCDRLYQNYFYRVSERIAFFIFSENLLNLNTSHRRPYNFEFYFIFHFFFLFLHQAVDGHNGQTGVLVPPNVFKYVDERASM